MSCNSQSSAAKVLVTPRCPKNILCKICMGKSLHGKVPTLKLLLQVGLKASHPPKIFHKELKWGGAGMAQSLLVKVHREPSD